MNRNQELFVHLDPDVHHQPDTVPVTVRELNTNTVGRLGRFKIEKIAWVKDALCGLGLNWMSQHFEKLTIVGAHLRVGKSGDAYIEITVIGEKSPEDIEEDGT